MDYPFLDELAAGLGLSAALLFIGIGVLILAAAFANLLADRGWWPFK